MDRIRKFHIRLDGCNSSYIDFYLTTERLSSLIMAVGNLLMAFLVGEFCPPKLYIEEMVESTSLSYNRDDGSVDVSQESITLASLEKTFMSEEEVIHFHDNIDFSIFFK